MARPAALVLVNPGARGGRGLERLARAWPAIEARFEARAVELDAQGRWRADVRRALQDGLRHFVAAGGDGTVGALADALCRGPGGVPLASLTLAAVGLGSSNDFHKPVRSRVAGIPLRLHAERWRDVGLVRYIDERGVARERVFLVSCSFGLTAAANAFFGGGDSLLRALRRISTGAAIVYAALHTILRGRGVRLALRLPGSCRRLRAASLSVLKTAHLAGSFRFDTPVDAGDGLLAVNLIEDRGRLATLGALAALARGRFLGRPGALHWSSPCVEVALTRPVPLEIDGEVVLARRARFEVLAERIRACA